jgi:hypothetical protein
MRALVLYIPMQAIYADEQSNLRVTSLVVDFPGKYLGRFLKRVFNSYLLRDCNAGSVQLLLGILFFGAWNWLLSVRAGVVASSGTVTLAAMPVLLGGHLSLGAVNCDIASVPRRCLHQLLS